MKKLFVLLLLVSPVFAQDHTNPYCGPGNVPQFPVSRNSARHKTKDMDGFATLPTRCMFTQISSTPSSNLPKYVGPSQSLLTVLSNAVPGDTILVDPANTTTTVKNLTLPNGQCPDKWITIRTSSTQIPDEFTQITPAFAAQLPKIILASQSTAIVGGQCVRLIGLEITRPQGTGIVYNLFNPGFVPGSHDIILDRMYVHGTVVDETNRGLLLNNVNNIAVINSYFSDFHCMAMVGACGDSQAIAGGLSTSPDGNYKVVNNYLEGAGENFIMGGGPGTVVVSDIMILYNILPKQGAWNPLDPSYAPQKGKDGQPHPWIVKNHFELKNGTRVLFEGNRMSYTWGGFTQVGASVLLTPKNQAGPNNTNQCAACAVTDITVRFNWSSWASQALQIGCGPSDNGGWPAACGSESIHDNLFDHLQYSTCYACGSFTDLLGGGSATVPMNNVNVVRNTFKVDGWINRTTAPGNGTASNAYSWLVAGTSNPTSMANIHVDNNVFDPGAYGVYSTGGGVVNNCWSTKGSIKDHVALCWPGGSMTNNQILQQSYFQNTFLPWPDGNTIVPPGTTPPPPPAGVGVNMDLLNAALANHHDGN